MTIEEAIKILELETRQEALSPYLDRPMEKMLDAMIEASRMGVSAPAHSRPSWTRAGGRGAQSAKRYMEKMIGIALDFMNIG